MEGTSPRRKPHAMAPATQHGETEATWKQVRLRGQKSHEYRYSGMQLAVGKHYKGTAPNDPPPSTSPIEWETQHIGLPTSATSRTQVQGRGKTQLDGGGGSPNVTFRRQMCVDPKKRKVARGKQLHLPVGSTLTTSDPGVPCSAQRTHNHEKKGADQKAG
jgi:hypothetical protein